MSLTFNGDDVQKVIFNGGEVSELYCDGVKVFPSVPAPGKALNDYTWAEISQIAKAGLGAQYFNIGDCKEITLNGNIGDQLTASNLKLCLFILDFNHVDNGVTNNNIIFGGFKTALTGGVDVALADIKYGVTNYVAGGKYFNMNHRGQTSKSGSAGYYNTNYGGWKGTDLRYDILGATSTPPSQYNVRKTESCVGYDATETTITNPVADSLLAALPSDLRSVLRLRTHYVDNKGNTSNTDEAVTAVTDAVSLLTEYEIFGSRSKANTYEKNHQSQMKYYSDGNSKVKCIHNDTTTAAAWWGCSPNCSTATGFCNVKTDGGVEGNSASKPLALAPVFKV